MKNLDIPDWPGSWSFEEVAQFPLSCYRKATDGSLLLLVSADRCQLTMSRQKARTKPVLSPCHLNPVSQRFYEEHLAETDEDRASTVYYEHLQGYEHYQLAL